MKKAIVTGLNGTLAPYVKNVLEEMGVIVFKWDRNAVSTEDEEEMEQFLEVLEPDYFFHLAMGSIEWTKFLAKYCFENKIKFIFTSTESIFQGNGPFTIDFEPNATSDYGLYKIKSEKVIKQNNQNAYIVRLGWQIGDTFSKNNMLNYLESTFQKKGYVEASDKWTLSTCYIKETAKWLVKIAFEMKPDIYQIEGNVDLSFYELVKLLEQIHHKDWKVRKVLLPDRCNCLIDERIHVQKIKDIFSVLTMSSIK